MFYQTIGTAESDWGGKTYAEIRDIGHRSGSVLVIPVGSIEQHGHHLPVSTDTILADAMVYGGAERVADEVPLLVTPPVWTGFSPHHLSFGGTVSLEHTQLVSLLEAVGQAGIENGFDAVLFVNGHGGNVPIVNTAISRVGRRTDAEVLATTYFRLAAEETGELRDSETGGMAHGGEFETSLMSYLREDLVGEIDEDSATMWDEHYERAGQDLLDSGSLAVYRPFETYSESGAIGAPLMASAEKGERIYENITTELAAIFTAVSEHNAKRRPGNTDRQ
jgi:creatinine amidohydrolase